MRGLVAVTLLLSFVLLSEGGGIKWTDQLTLTATTNAGWGRLIRNFQGQDLLTYSQYNHPLPNGCDSGYNQPGPSCVVLTKNSSSTDWSSWKVISQQDSPNVNGKNYIQEQSILFPVPNSNRLLMVMRNRLPDCSWFGLPVVHSEDGGKSWNFLSQLDQTTSPSYKFNRGLWEPFMYLLPNGCIAGFFADETHADQNWNQIIGERVSCDGGQTWGNEIFAMGQQDGVSRPGMPGVARLANGHTILVGEVCGPANCQIHYKISVDGVNWPAGLGTPMADQFNGPYVAVLPTGRVVVTCACTNTISLSDDNGNTWYETDKAFNVNCNSGGAFTWPAIYSLGGNQVGVIASGLSGSIVLRIGTSI